MVLSSIMYFKYATAAIAAVLPLCSAQTYSDCNPLESMCFPSDMLAVAATNNPSRDLPG